ncbi:MAG: Do family serine endopeptidase [Desulfobacterales bacterium]
MVFKHNRTMRYLFFFIIVVLALGVTQCGSQSSSSAAAQNSSAAATAPATANPSAVENTSMKTAAAQSVNPSGETLITAVAKVAKESLPAVVHIDVTESQEVKNPLLPFENDPFFHYFFNVPRHMPRKFKRELMGLGSGMIMNDKGYILTNNHVVAGANTIQVYLADGRNYPGKVVGTDPKTDLAVVKIKTDEKLPHVTFGDSDKMEVGDWVVAIGAPRGLDQTVTQGIISAKHRRGILNPSSYQDYLQTDAAINPGNSGGPLLNLKGEVIGINSAIISESGGFEGIGFAIPSDIAVHIADELIKNGKVVRGWLGVSIRDVTPALQESMKLSVSKGALIVEVVKGGPADKAGLQKNDVITMYQGKAIRNSSDLQNQVANTPPGKEVDITVVRNGKSRNFKVKVANLQNAVKIMAASVNKRLGVVVRPVTEKEAQEYGMQAPKGVAIKMIQPNGLLGKAGFEVNDIILAINGQPVSGVQSFVDIVESLKPHQWIQFLVLDHRTGQTGYIRVMLD